MIFVITVFVWKWDYEQMQYSIDANQSWDNVSREQNDLKPELDVVPAARQKWNQWGTFKTNGIDAKQVD